MYFSSLHLLLEMNWLFRYHWDNNTKYQLRTSDVDLHTAHMTACLEQNFFHEPTIRDLCILNA
jgi:hypothetical protein